MGYKEITPGDKIAKPRAARFIKSSTGKLGIEVSFTFKEESTDTTESLNWVAWLSDAAIKYSMATLVDVLGYNGSADTNETGVLTDPVAIAYDRQVKLVVEIQEYEGKSGPRIKYVNSLGGSAFGSCTPETIKQDLAEAGFKAAFLMAKKNSGLPKQATPPKEEVSEEDIPF